MPQWLGNKPHGGVVLSSCRAVGTVFFGLLHSVLNDQDSSGYAVVTHWIIECVVRVAVPGFVGWQDRSRWWSVRCPPLLCHFNLHRGHLA